MCGFSSFIGDKRNVYYPESTCNLVIYTVNHYKKYKMGALTYKEMHCGIGLILFVLHNLQRSYDRDSTHLSVYCRKGNYSECFILPNCSEWGQFGIMKVYFSCH